jgi:actin cytoskeleton-regulatory complex protein SLA1
MQMSTYGRPQEHYAIRNPITDGKFKSWQVEEIDSRKRRKRGTLAIGNSSIVWSCESSRVPPFSLVLMKEPVQTWPVTSLIEYNTEKKHVFIELSSPPVPASFHFHTDSRAIASDIAAAIGEIAGATRAPGLREVAAASGDPLPPLPETSALAQRHKREDSDEVLPIDDGVKRGVMLYDFDAQGEDELGVRQDQIVEILDDSHEEWWKCKSGTREGVVPASYVEVVKTRPAPKKEKQTSDDAPIREKERKKTSSPPKQTRANLAKPDPSKTRTWTDRSGSFKVEAQFLGLADEKIQLHKLNGVKISVPLGKMSLEDVAYVERLTGRQTSPPPPKPPPDSEKPKGTTRRIEFDWFQFFLESGVDYNVCQRYAINFERDQMDEGVLPDINSDTLRTLGVREGDILRIMKRLDEKFGRSASRKKSVRFGGVDEDEEKKDDLADVVKVHAPERKESIFSSGPSGALRNNTSRRGRPTTTKAVSDEVDPTLLSASAQPEEPDREKGEKHGVRPLRVPPSRLANMSETENASNAGGFEDDAWTVKEQRQRAPQQIQQPPTVQIQSPPPQAVQAGPPPRSAMHDLSSINTQSINQSLPQPLQPQITPQPVQLSPQPTASPMAPRPASVPPVQSAPQAQPLQAQLTGLPPQGQYHPPMPGPTPAQASGTPSLDEQLVKLQLYKQHQMLQAQQTGYMQVIQPQPTGYMNGFASQPPQLPTLTGVPSQSQTGGFMPNFLPPGQQSSVLGPTRSLSASLPPPLIPANTASPSTPQYLTSHRTGPANFASVPQYQPLQTQLPPQPTGFQPMTMQPQMTGFQPQPQMLPPQTTGMPSFLPPPQPNALAPQVTGFQQQMMPQKTGVSEFKPVSFGTQPKPLIPTRTGRARANLAAASISQMVYSLHSSTGESIWILRVLFFECGICM